MPGGDWKAWAAETVQREAGRSLALAIGLVLLAVATVVLTNGSKSRQHAGYLLLVGGLSMAFLGCRRVKKLTTPIGSVEMQDDPIETARWAAVVPEPVEGEPVPALTAETNPTPTIVPTADLLAAARYYVADRSIRALLTPTDGPLANCDLHLYLYDDVAERLYPIFEPDPDHPSEGWPAGVGVVGVAYAQGGYILATGDATSDGTYGLSEEQQERYSALVTVAATPVVNAAGETLGVLAASSSDPTDELPSEDGKYALLVLGLGVGRILVDLLSWYTDGDDTED